MSLHITTAGKGPRLVMLHGWGLNSRVWDPILPRLSERFTTVCIDLPGHGTSSWPPKFHDIDSLAQLIEPYLESKGSNPSLSPCFLLGWSLGSMVALALAAKHPNSIRRLVLVAPTPKFVRSADWPHGTEEKVVDDFAVRVSTEYRATIREFLALQVHGDENARAVLQVLREKVLATGEPYPEALSAGLGIFRAADLRDRLSRITVPTLAITGERDRLTPPGAATALASALPHAQLYMMKRAAHAPFISHPEDFCFEIERFLLDRHPVQPDSRLRGNDAF